MKWSRYNFLFESKRNGWMLFNSASRSFLLIEPDQVEAVKGIAADPEGFNYDGLFMLYTQLRNMGFLVEDGKDDDFFAVEKMRNLTALYADPSLSLTIAITRACNFDCSYCYEGNRTGKPMTKEVENKLIAFIKSFRSNKLSLTWYGGEPLLAYDRICSIDQRLKDMGKEYTAAMITNGYLMNDEIIANLNNLRINYLQITLDGKEETHDGRRYLKGGGKTYQVILKNVEKILASDFKGTIHIRVNVDARNEDEFAFVYKYFLEKFPKDFGKRITVYPGFVKGDDHPDVSCFFDSKQQGEFIARMYDKYGIVPLTIFPNRGVQGCTLTRRNSFVVGPDGELYKCWDDVGLKHKVVGTIDVKNNWNMPLIAEGMVTCNFLDDPECKKCGCFPICNGGCHRIRQDNLHREYQHSSCTYFRDNIEYLLELHYERKMKIIAEQNRRKEQAAKEASEQK